METLNWVLVSALTALAALAAVALSFRLDLEGRAERALAFSLLFWALIVAPIFTLGYCNWLYRAPVALLSLALSGGVLALCARGQSVAAFWARLRSELVELATLLPDSVKLCWRARSFSVLGLLGALGVLAFTVFLTYLAPADESWDGLYYHQPIVGFALQSHGFGLVELPNTVLAQTINGYPKLGEAFSLWFVLFTDKTWIEIGGSLAAPGLMLAIYLLARRYTTDRAACVGWATVVLLMPAISSQLRSTMIDIELWLFALGAVHFATRVRFRPQHAALALLACALLLGTKSTGLVLVPPILLAVCVRGMRRSEDSSFALSIAAGLALVASIGALTLVRNFRAFHDPFWPVSYRNAALGLDFPGLATLQQVAPDPKFAEFLRRAYDSPARGVRDIILRGYGYAVPWVVLPFGVLGLADGLVVAARGVLRRAREPLAENLSLVALLTLLPLCASPSFSNARYNLQAVAVAVLGIVWLSERRSAPRLQEGALAASVSLSLMAMVWSGYLWGLSLTFADIGQLAAHSKAERASLNFSSFQMPPRVAALREAELGPGDMAVFTRDLSFIGVLWNDKFSNRVSYLSPAGEKSLLAELARRDARWVAVGANSASRRLLDRSPGYEFVGSAAQQDKTVIYRRRLRGGAAPTPAQPH
jgi:hypothetical protein